MNEVVAGSASMSDELIEESKRVFPGAVFSLGFGTTELGPVAFAPHPSLPTPRGSVGIAHPAVAVELRGLDGNTLAAEGPLPSASRTASVTESVPDAGAVTAPALDEITPAESVTGELCLASRRNVGVQGPARRTQSDDRGFYVTGDLFERDAQGFYFFRGRVDDMFTSGGENVYPAAVWKRCWSLTQGSRRPPGSCANDTLKGAKPRGIRGSRFGCRASRR